ncbi:MAG TPA: hypothetical protein VGC74_08985 [Stenotrophomonas sp.]|jgi:hypothetical protein
MTLRTRLFALALVLACSSCAAAPTPPATKSTAPAVSPVPAVVVALDATCRTDADCTVKNVGNCCGAFPACVNVASPTNPAAVQAQCRASGRMSVCGFREISACQCVQGQCAAKGAGTDTLRRPIDSPEPIR